MKKINKTHKLALIAIAVASFGINQSMAQAPISNGAKPSTVVTTVMPSTVSKVGVSSTPAKTTVTVTNPSNAVSSNPGVTTSVVSTPASTVVTSSNSAAPQPVNASTNAAVTTISQPASNNINVNSASEISKNAKPVESTLKSIGQMKARLDEIKLLQDLKEAEHKLSQPIENKKDATSANPSTSAMGNIVAPSFNPVLKGTNSSTGSSGTLGADMSEKSLVVYSVIGFDGDYSAKVSLDGQSTYTVKKGDVLPNGQMVTEINRYYLVVAEKSAIGRPLAQPQRIYVTGRPLASTTSAAGGAAGSTATRAIPGSSNMIGALPSNIVSPGGAPFTGLASNPSSGLSATPPMPMGIGPGVPR